MGGVNVVEWELTDGLRLRLASLVITMRGATYSVASVVGATGGICVVS